MFDKRCVNDAVHWYMSELSSRVVAESGRPTDRHHLGKLILQALKDAPDFILQIDGATGESETNASVLERSVKCAVSMKKFGLKVGDVISLWAPNHLDIAIVYYAALYTGVIFSAIDKNATIDELTKVFECEKPKLIFCQTEKLTDIQEAVKESKLETKIVTFDENKDISNGNCCSFVEFVNNYADDIKVDEFKAADFDPETTVATIIGTSGSTGLPKKSILTHMNFVTTGPHLWSKYTTFPAPTRMVLIPAPIQWISTTLQLNMSPILRFTRLQSSQPSTTKHLRYLIDTYKPTYLVSSTSMLINLIASDDQDQCDFSSFEHIVFGGSSVPSNLIEDVKKLMPNAEVFESYGFSEASTYQVFEIGTSPPGSCGKPTGYFKYRLVDIESLKDITEPNKPGELWIKGPGVSKGYFNNPEATRQALTEDGWFKSGDILYRDENWNFYFVERVKMLIRYRTYLISPAELESVIRQHSAVFDVAITEIPDYECMTLPVACVVKKPGHNVTAKDIKDLVKDKLEDWKQLRGGVVFLKELPLTSTTKIDRRKLKEIVISEVRE